MHRTSAAGHVNHQFVAENPNIGQPPTALEPDFFNMVQEELVAVVEAADLTLDANNNGQLLEAIAALISSAVGGIDLSGLQTTANTVLVPVGGIIMWSGSIATIPTHWHLCDGTNATPDLRNTFVIGASSDDTGVAKTTVTGVLTKTGGSKDAVVVNHTHPVPTKSGTQPQSGDATQCWVGDGTATSGGASGGESGENKNLPPYYAMAYIMRTS